MNNWPSVTQGIIALVLASSVTWAQTPCFEISIVLDPPTGFTWSGASPINDDGMLGIDGTFFGLDPAPFIYASPANGCGYLAGQSAIDVNGLPLGRVSAFDGCVATGHSASYATGAEGWIHTANQLILLPKLIQPAGSPLGVRTSMTHSPTLQPGLEGESLPQPYLIESVYPEAIRDIGDQLLVGGSVYFTDGTERPVLYRVPWNGAAVNGLKSYQTIGQEPGSIRDIDGSGTWACGQLVPGNIEPRAAIFDLVNSEVAYLPNLGGIQSVAYSINEQGTEAVGFSTTTSGDSYAVRWLRNGSSWSIEDFGTLPGIERGCQAYDSNERYIIGQCSEDETHNFIIDRTTMVMEPLQICDPIFNHEEFTLIMIGGINSHDQIATVMCLEGNGGPFSNYYCRAGMISAQSALE